MLTCYVLDILLVLKAFCKQLVEFVLKGRFDMVKAMEPGEELMELCWLKYSSF